MDMNQIYNAIMTINGNARICLQSNQPNQAYLLYSEALTSLISLLPNTIDTPLFANILSKINSTNTHMTTCKEKILAATNPAEFNTQEEAAPKANIELCSRLYEYAEQNFKTATQNKRTLIVAIYSYKIACVAYTLLASQGDLNAAKMVNDIKEKIKVFIPFLEKNQTHQEILQSNEYFDSEQKFKLFTEAGKKILQAYSSLRNNVEAPEFSLTHTSSIPLCGTKKFIDSQHTRIYLNETQRPKLLKWTRMGNIYPFLNQTETLIAKVITPLDIISSFSSDSLGQMLSMCANYELISKKEIISANIYPQNGKREPIYNPLGQYKVKLYINGLWRLIEIDDVMPVSVENHPLTIISKSQCMWPLIYEKAIAKIYGRYIGSELDFNIPKYITSFIPTRVLLSQFTPITMNMLWENEIMALLNAQCMLLVVSSQAVLYTVLNAYQDGVKRYLLLKGVATPSIKKANISSEEGTFYIAFEDLFNISIFSEMVSYWPSQIHQFRDEIVSIWDKDYLIEDIYSVKHNPQFMLKCDMAVPMPPNGLRIRVMVDELKQDLNNSNIIGLKMALVPANSGKIIFNRNIRFYDIFSIYGCNKLDVDIPIAELGNLVPVIIISQALSTRVNPILFK